MKKLASQILTLFVLSLCLLSTAASTEGKSKKGMNCLFIGHSFFVPVSKVFKKLPGQAGVKNHQQQMVFSGGKSGSPGELWKGRKKAAIQKILESGKIELLGMTFFSAENSSFKDYKRWIDLALKHNPKTSFFIGLPWAKSGDKRKLAEYTDKNKKADKILFETVEQLRKKYPDKKFYYLNYGMAYVELKRLFEAGELPEIKTLKGKQGIYRDATSHANPILLELSALLWLNTLYDIDIEKTKLKSRVKTDLKKIASKIIANQKAK
jgi:hypothetical protein